VTAKWRSLLLLGLAELLAMSLWFSASAATPALMRAWHLTAAQAAWLTMAVQIGFVTGALGAAVLNVAERWSAPRVFAVGAVAGALANALIPALDVRLPGAIALRFVTGVTLAAVYPVGMAVMATWAKEDRGLWIGVLVGALTVGSATPHLVRALGGVDDWPQVMYGVSLLAVAAAAIVWLGVGLGPYGAARPRPSWSQFTALVRERPLRLANAGYLGHMWELYAMWTWLPAFLAASYRAGQAAAAPGVAERYASLVAFAAIAAGGAGSVVWGRLGDRWGRTRSTILSMAVSGCCALAIGLTFGRAPLLAMAVALVWGFTVVADSAQFSTAVSELCDPAYTGTALAAQVATGFLLTMVSIQLLPVVAGPMGWQWTFALLAPGPVLGSLAMWRLMRSPEAGKLAGGRG